MKYVLVTGGVVSGLGKGVTASSIGVLLKNCGLRVTSIKIDPYLNIDAGTMSPFEHGEVFVLDDGGEVDLDLGNYERFLDVTLSRDNNITTGKIYQQVIERERRGDYLGKTVQVVPHITDAIQDWVEKVAKKPDESGKVADVCIIELGGTIGDIESMPFVEAFRQFQFRVGADNFLLALVSLVPQPSGSNEQKTKPTQHSVRELRGLGLSPHIIVCRSTAALHDGIARKISSFCHVPETHVLAVPDLSSIYRVPLLLEAQNVVKLIFQHFRIENNIQRPEDAALLTKWRDLADRYDTLRHTVHIAIVGKYTGLSDAYTSVVKALQHSALKAGHKLHVEWVEAELLEEATLRKDPINYHAAWGRLCQAKGILVPGGFGNRGVEGKIAAVQWAREQKIPFLGVCLGLQVAVIEFCRNVLGWKTANSTEFDEKTEHPVVIDMPEISKTHMGGTMRLGKRRTIFVDDACVMRKLYGDQPHVDERHRHRYEVNPDIVAKLEAKGMKFVGRDEVGNRMEVMELENHPYFTAVQYHPEFLSRPLRPSPPFFGFILASCGMLESWIAKRPASPEVPFLRPSAGSDADLARSVSAHAPATSAAAVAAAGAALHTPVDSAVVADLEAKNAADDLTEV